MEAAKSGKSKVNSGTLYPYEIVDKYIGNSWNWNLYTTEDASIEAMWNNLPDYVDDINGSYVKKSVDDITYII